MPRTFKLTWQAGTNNRVGRWRKKYQGKVYYFAGGRGKYDRDAHEAAVSAWQALKDRIDAAAPRPFEQEHQQAIGVWEQVLAWSNRHADRDMAARAYDSLALIRQKLAIPELKPLPRADEFDAAFDTPTIPIPDSLLSGIDISALAGRFHPPRLDSKDRARYSNELDGSPSRIAREIWHDRLEVQQRRAAAPDDSVGAHVEQFLQHKKQLVGGGELSVGRLNALRMQLSHFQDWIGKETAVKEIDGNALIRYHASLLENVGDKTWSKNTAYHYLAGAKAFVRWLWQTEAIPTLPRILDGRSKLLNITRPTIDVVVFTKQEIAKLLKAATARTKLYILLMLNCGMTQKDISDLLVSEVDWKVGRIIRKRSKTADEKNVPVVNYMLWPKTFRLLKQERSPKGCPRALLNSDGGPLWSEEEGANDKYKKTDNVKNAFDRLRKRLGINKPLKSLKKTSASLLRDNERFQGLEGLFLGHAPQSMSDKHYTHVPQQLLNTAVQWLGKEYGKA